MSTPRGRCGARTGAGGANLQELYPNKVSIIKNKIVITELCWAEEMQRTISHVTEEQLIQGLYQCVKWTFPRFQVIVEHTAYGRGRGPIAFQRLMDYNSHRSLSLTTAHTGHG